MILYPSSWKGHRERNLIICFSFLTYHAFIEGYVLAIATCAYLITGKISRVHTSVVCSVSVRRKHFVLVRSTKWMVPGYPKHTYLSGTHVIVDSI